MLAPGADLSSADVLLNCYFFRPGTWGQPEVNSVNSRAEKHQMTNLLPLIQSSSLAALRQRISTEAPKKRLPDGLRRLLSFDAVVFRRIGEPEAELAPVFVLRNARLEVIDQFMTEPEVEIRTRLFVHVCPVFPEQLRQRMKERLVRFAENHLRQHPARSGQILVDHLAETIRSLLGFDGPEIDLFLLFACGILLRRLNDGQIIIAVFEQDDRVVAGFLVSVPSVCRG